MSWEQQFMLKGLCLLTGYLLGGFLTAEIVARCMAGVSIRYIGDGGPTARNLARHLGKPAAFAAWLLRNWNTRRCCMAAWGRSVAMPDRCGAGRGAAVAW